MVILLGGPNLCNEIGIPILTHYEIKVAISVRETKRIYTTFIVHPLFYHTASDQCTVKMVYLMLF